MKCAIMQPYLFPYIGYFQMINSVDSFVFYDDVNYIKKGWVNRNRILIQGKDAYFNINLKEASQNKLINETEVSFESSKILKTIEQNYKKAPYFQHVYPLLSQVFTGNHRTISEYSIDSIVTICDYLNLKREFKCSSLYYSDTKKLERAERLKEICRLNSADIYINALGGQELYSKSDFAQSGIELFFIKSRDVKYKQFKDEFVPWLSIIDVLMFNSKEDVRMMLTQYELI
jgi:hypothetical protein